VINGHLSRVMSALQRSPVVSYILDSQFRILYCNPAWNRFASANGAPQLTSDAVIGFDLFDAIPDNLRGLYCDTFRKVLSTGRVWEETYQCSSPTVFRIFRMRIHLLKPQNWLIVTNPLLVERPHTKTTPPDSNTYVDANGFVTMCAHCRCSRRLDDLSQWDFVPEYLKLSPESAIKVSHGLCPVCRAYFYPLN
jgi:PAS fold